MTGGWIKNPFTSGEMWQVGYDVCGDEHKVGPEEGELWIFSSRLSWCTLVVGLRA